MMTVISYKFSLHDVSLLNLIHCMLTIVVRNDALDRGGRSIGLSERHHVQGRLRLISLHFRGVNSRIISLSELLDFLQR